MKSCPSCAHSNPDETAFCTECGARLGASQHPPLIARPSASDPREAATPVRPLLAHPSHSPSSPPTPGTIIDGKYVVESVIGEGAMGVVYLARDLMTETRVVVKSIRAEFADNAEFRARAIEEGRVLARIDHPNVVRLNAVVLDATGLYLVMQYIEGNSLDKLIAAHRERSGFVPLDEAMRIFRMVLQGVAAAHHEGVIHRDLKPANILVRARDGAVKVSDFGIAKTGPNVRTGRVQTVGVIGSPAYMAPEQRIALPDLDRRADIYSLGIVLFELLVGQLPFVAATEAELFQLHVEARLPALATRRPDLPPQLDQVIARACAKDRAHRFSTCEEFDAALAQAVIRPMRSVPPTIMATQGLPSLPPPPALPRTPSISPSRPVARTMSDAPLPMPAQRPMTQAAPLVRAPKYAQWITIFAVAIALLAGAIVAILFAIGTFAEHEPALVDPPAPRPTASAPTPSTPNPAKHDAGPTKR